ncbi:MAG: type II toxin-antitoxin system RelE/ParE family toxin [Treponema sp.]|nr:type II toxin-antitoxin system RelE/ParE family toxin [Treponema sp.]
MYEIEQTEPFSAWLHGLKDNQARARIRARVERAHLGNFGDWSPEGGEVRAMRIDYGPGYRLYFTIRGDRIVILLCGGDKRTQEADIKQAHKLAKEIV